MKIKKNMLFKLYVLVSVLFFVNLYSQNMQQSQKTVFITGGAGFIGSNFLKYMYDKYPNYHFMVLDSLTYAGNLENIPAYIRDSDRFEFHYGSVTNPDIVNSLMPRSNFVVHFAAESHVTRSINDDKIFLDTDIIGTRMMISSLVKNKDKVERFIHISTSEVLGTAKAQPMDENHPLNPRSPYAAAKTGADRLVYSYWCTHDIPALIIRPFNNYGPQQHLEKMIPRFITRVLKEEPITIHGDGSQKRDWIHTHDLCKALDLALHLEDFSKIKNQVIHIGSGKATSVLEIARQILRQFDLEEKDNIKFVDNRPGQVDCHISSIEKSKKLLNWNSEISLKKGIEDTIKWYSKNKNYWQKMEKFMMTPITTKDNLVKFQ